MNSPSERIKQSELVNRLVLNRQTTEEIGRVGQLWVDPPMNSLVGFTCKMGFLGREERYLPWAWVQIVGADSVLVDIPEAEVPAKPDNAETVIGHELWTDSGDKAGRVTDYVFDPRTGAIAFYLFSCKGWRGVTDGTYQIPAATMVSIGRRRAIAKVAAVQNAERYAEGLGHRLQRATEFLQGDLQKTREEVGDVGQKLRDLREQAHGKFAWNCRTSTQSSATSGRSRQGNLHPSQKS
ncbi:MAG: hypothetical protein HC925_07680, partial [Coleofasciculaceae cyanobacterium SM2_3_26]|nr:hypothetical protein [Coleofasciculaceae cyanobacterium SM2_3_26]